ncbi:MAG: glycine--tRNA ligase [Candidatus Vogelbacteria bacterium RIFOXYD1_FULL_46_19]|uniref:glycine--tRNA ligase n=1 Tax=Candidatus Vogelbacteria bacterium RIFOXYD1_FULL_46_19 TaxID=1802439 RepID=A0A1G2QJX5_9BACT|nr:MAG: glycine--tRNA ligase [Candidatus Vogelbacteria bacterium RIFOXYD1_FULL_46_19]
MVEQNVMEKIVSLAKRRGFVYQGSEIYGGLAGTYDYAPLGVALKNNLKNIWWRRFVLDREDMYGFDAAILMNAKVWESSGHVGGFADPVVECSKCRARFRADHLDNEELCPTCGGALGSVQEFNMMFETKVGASSVEDNQAISYLRPETAQGMFVNFKNILDTFHPKLPFGLAQIGKAFRNEIAPRDFLFRTREFEQMEIEYFVRPNDWEVAFQELRAEILAYLSDIGLKTRSLHELEVPEGERAHYSKRTIDVEFDYPFGQKELCGLAYRTDYDLQAHQTGSQVDLTFFDEGSKERFLPHVIEPSLGVDRLVLAVLCDAYTEDEMGGESRAYFKFSRAVAPVKAAVFPLLKNKPELVAKARAVYEELKKVVPQIMWDDNGNIGKRYRRQDEIGTPSCITIDFDTLSDNTVTIRDRDTGSQSRVAIDSLPALIAG